MSEIYQDLVNATRQLIPVIPFERKQEFAEDDLSDTIVIFENISHVQELATNGHRITVPYIASILTVLIFTRELITFSAIYSLLYK